MLMLRRLIALSLGVVLALPLAGMAEPAPSGVLSYHLGETAGARHPIDPDLADPEHFRLLLADGLSPPYFPAPPLLPNALPAQPRAEEVAPPAPPTTTEAEAPWLLPLQVALVICLLSILLRNLLQWPVLWRGLQQRHHAGAITTADWPELSIVFPPGYAPELLAQRIHSLLHSGYPAERLYFLPISSSDQPILRDDIARYLALPATRIVPVSTGMRLHDALSMLRVAFVHAPTDLLIVADPIRPLLPDQLKQAVAPFLDPAVGAIQGTRHGRAPATTLSRLLDLARHALVAQHDACSHTSLLPGATVLGLRRRATLDCGDPQSDLSSEVEFVTRLAARGWHTAMQPAFSDVRPVAQRWDEYLRRIRQGYQPGLRGLPVFSLLWLGCAVLSVALYFAGTPLLAGLGLLICAFHSFDARGEATSLLRLLIPARTRRQPQQFTLLPLLPLLHALAAVHAVLAWGVGMLPRSQRTRAQLLAATRQETLT